jgi:hypothetical protein
MYNNNRHRTVANINIITIYYANVNFNIIEQNILKK